MGQELLPMPIEEVLKERAKAREEVIEEVRRYVESLRERWGRITAVLFGSYARGDFNLWSDVDLIITSERFRGTNFVTRCVALLDAPPRVEAICWTPEEAAKALGKPWWREALKHRIVITDDYGIFGVLS